VIIGQVRTILFQIYIPTSFAIGWNKICNITKSDLTTALGTCLTKLSATEENLDDIVIE
jgi:hypothetical protein